VRRGPVRSQVRSLAIMRALALVPGLLAVQTVLLTRSHAAQTDPVRLTRAVYVAAVVPALGDAPGRRCLWASRPVSCERLSHHGHPGSEAGNMAGIAQCNLPWTCWPCHERALTPA